MDARSKRKRGGVTYAALTTILASALTGMLSDTAWAAPMGAQVTAGAGEVSQAGTLTTVQQSSKNLSVNWSSFNVGAQETVNFVQPSASAIAVNRISDIGASQIQGRLNANGQVFLINPNGILFGSTAQVNVGGIVASTQDLVSDINDPVRRFSGNGTGSVTNLGTIHADGGYAALLANQVGNQGVITARLGTVALGAGNGVTLNFQGDDLIGIQVDRSTFASLARNGGLIVADGGQVMMRAGARDALIGSMLNNEGVIEARTLENRNGTIVLSAGGAQGGVHIAGRIDASAAQGGHAGAILIGGQNIDLAGAVLDASGSAAASGGTILIGGAAHGAAINGLRTAESTSIDSATSINANGGGGTVVLWSNQNTRFAGDIKAGDGWVETSSHGMLTASGQVSAREWLLDPSNVTIAAGAGSNLNETTTGGTNTPSAGASSSTIYAANINTALTGGTAVTISTTSTGSGTGNITLAAGAAISTTNAAALTLNADANIILNGNISLGTGALALNANGGSISGAGNISSAGSKTFNAGLASASGTLSGVIAGTGNLVKSGAGTLALSGSNTYTGTTTINGGTLQVAGAGTLGSGTYSRAIAIVAGGLLDYASSATQILSGTISGAGGLSKNASVSVLTLAAGNSYTGATTVNAGTLALKAGVAIAGGSAVTINNGGTLRFDVTDIWGVNNSTSATPAITINAGGTLASNNTFNRVNGLTMNGGTRLANGGKDSGFQAFQLAGTVNITANSSFVSGSVGNGYNNIALGQANLSRVTFNFSPGTSLSISNRLRDYIGTATAPGLVMNGAGTLDLSGQSSYTGSLTINAGLLRISGAGYIGSGNYGNTIALAAGTLLDYASSANQTLYGSISGAGALTKDTSASSVLTLGSNNTYTGATTAGLGTLALAGLNAISINSPVAVNNGATLRLDWTDIWGAAINPISTPQITVNAGGTLASNNSFNVLSGLNLNGGTLLANGGLRAEFEAFGLAGTVTVTADSSIVSGTVGNGLNAVSLGKNGLLTTTFNISAGKTLGSAVGILDHGDFGATNLVVTGGGTLLLNGLNKYTGTTTLDGATLRIGGAGVLGAGSYGGAIAISGASVFDASSSADQVLSGAISGAGTLLKNGSAGSTLTLAGASSGSGVLQVNNGTLSLAGSWTPSSGNAMVTVAAGAAMNGGGSISANSLQISGAGSVNLGGANHVGSIAASGTAAELRFNNAQSLAVGSIASSGKLVLTASGENSDLSLNNGSVLSALSSGDAITLAAGRNFINHSGASVLRSPNGRWQIYSAAPAGDLFNQLDSLNTALWNTTFASANGSVSAAGNRYVFAWQPVLTVTSLNLAKTYGENSTAAVARAYAISGVQGGVAGAFAGDTAGAVYSGLPSVGSAGAGQAANAGTYVNEASAGSLVLLNGYRLSTLSRGIFTVAQAPLLVSANSVNKIFDGQAFAGGNGVVFSGFVNGDNAAVLDGTLQYAGSAQGASASGSYSLSAAGLSSRNYSLRYQAGTLRIAPADELAQVAVLNGATTPASLAQLASTAPPSLAAEMVLVNVAPSAMAFDAIQGSSVHALSSPEPAVQGRAAVSTSKAALQASCASARSRAETAPPEDQEKERCVVEP